MSNHLAIATVTASLGELVLSAAERALGATVTLQFGRPTPPSSGSSERKVHVYLYQVTPNAALRNNDLPTRGRSGQLSQRPRVALDLHYLLSFYGDDRTLEPDRMVGAVTRDLHAGPVLSTRAIGDAIDSRSELRGSDLAAATEPVKFTPTQISLDEMSRLWSIMVQTPHVLSIVYQASVVLIDAESLPTVALPVLRRGEDDRGVTTNLESYPRLERWWAGVAAAEPAPRSPSFPAARLGLHLLLEGVGLGADVVAVRFSHSSLPARDLDIAPEERNSEKLTLALPDDAVAQNDWAAGIYTVTAVLSGDTATRLSNTLPFTLAPHVAEIQPNPALRDPAGVVSLRVTCRPRVHLAQTVSLLLADREIHPQTIASASDTLTFEIADAPVLSNTFIRLRVDGVDSMPFDYDEPSRRFVFDDRQRLTIT